ncbi:MAG: hypothetical protein J2P28_16130 [Actinobacteria bacterium]|nr:hypothetical protein [Actinomycetota bacterium]
MISLGNNVHIFARPHRRAELARCFEQVLACPVRPVVHPAMPEPMLLVDFPGGGHLSIEFRGDAPDEEDKPRLGAWLELRAEDPSRVMSEALDAGFRRVEHPGHPHYFAAPGGQVFTVAPLS